MWKAMALCGVILFGLGGAVAQAAEPGITDGVAIPGLGAPSVSTTVPPAFDPSAASSITAGILSCFNIGPSLNALGALALGEKSGTKPDGSCSAIEVSDRASLSCQQFSPGGLFDPQLALRQQEEIDEALGAIACKKGKMDQARQEIGCLTSQNQALEAQVSVLTKAFQQNIQKMQTDMQQIKSVEADRKAQLEETVKRLQGDKESGRLGLIQLRDLTETAVNQTMPDGIAAVKKAFENVDQQTKLLDEQVADRRMTITNDCFNSVNARATTPFRCKPNGPVVSIHDYVLCRYEQNQQVSANGRIEQNTALAAQAASNRAALDSIFKSIFGESAPKIDPAAAKDPAKAAELASRPVTITSVADVEKNFGAALQAFNGNGLDIKSFIMTQMTSCFKRADATVNQERKQAKSPVGAAVFQLKQAQDDAAKEANKQLELFSQLYTKNLSGLTGVHIPQNTSACKAGSPPVKIACLNDLKTNMEGLLNGNSPNSTMNTIIRGTEANTAIPLSCQGLQGCINDLQNVQSNLTKETKRLDLFKQSYVLKANQAVENFAQQMAQMLSPQSTLLQQRLNQLNQQIAQFGGRPINLRSRRGEPLQKDEDGLPKTPRNVLDYVGSQMNPPMPDMGDESLNRGLTEMSRLADEMTTKQARMARQKADLATLATTCKQQDLVAAVTKLGNSTQNIDSCTFQSWCEENVGRGPDSIDAIKDSLEQAQINMGGEAYNLAGDIITKLDGGIANCDANQKAATKLDDINKKLVPKKGELAELQATPAGAAGSPESKTRAASIRALTDEIGLLETEAKKYSERAGRYQNGQRAASCNGVSTLLSRGLEKVKGAQGDGESGAARAR